MQGFIQTITCKARKNLCGSYTELIPLFFWAGFLQKLEKKIHKKDRNRCATIGERKEEAGWYKWIMEEEQEFRYLLESSVLANQFV